MSHYFGYKAPFLASSADNILFVRKSSLALSNPTCLAKKYVDDPSGVNPEAVYAETNFALSDAKM